MIRGLLFDLDGVLVNTNPLHARAWQELAEELEIPFTPADYEAFLGTVPGNSAEKGKPLPFGIRKREAVHPEK